MAAFFGETQAAYVCSTETCGTVEDGVEDGLQVVRRVRSGAQHFRDGRLLLDEISQSLLCALELVDIQIHTDPLHYRSIARPERFGATEEPGIASLSARNPKTPLTTLTRAQSGRPIFLCFCAVVRMHKGKMGVPLCANVDA